MLTHTTDPPRPEERFVADGSERDTVVVLSAVPFAVYEALLKARRDAPAPRYAYRNGDLGACLGNHSRRPFRVCRPFPALLNLAILPSIGAVSRLGLGRHPLLGGTRSVVGPPRRGLDTGPGYQNTLLEIMRPGRAHERTKKNLARLIEAYGMLRDVPVTGMGSWTLKRRLEKTGVEPDECYFVGRDDGEAPDLAIEVVMSIDALDKLPIYARLGVREVWIWRRGALTVHALQGETYTQVGRSTLLPGLDLTMLTMLAPQTDQHAALQTWMRWLCAGA